MLTVFKLSNMEIIKGWNENLELFKLKGNLHIKK